MSKSDGVDDMPARIPIDGIAGPKLPGLRVPQVAVRGEIVDRHQVDIAWADLHHPFDMRHPGGGAVAVEAGSRL